MRSVVFLLLRLICYPALAAVLLAAIAVAIISVNGQCPPVSEIGVTCAGKRSQALADFGLGVLGITLDTGLPLVLAVVGVVLLWRDIRRARTTA